MKEEINSKKSKSVYTVALVYDRAYITVSGEASTERHVLDEINRIRKGRCSFSEALWTAKMLANTY